MPLPKRVREAAEAADAAIAQLNALETPQPPLVDPVTGEPLVAATPAEPVVTQPVSQPVEDWEKKYRSLQGKYDSEVPLMRSQLQNYERMNSQLSGQLANLSDQVRLLQERPVAPVATQQAPAVTDVDVSQFGPELIDLVQRIVRGENVSQMAALRSDVDSAVAPVRNSVQTVAADQKVIMRQTYEAGLTAAVPDWRTIDVSPEWLNWLKEFDPILGATRQAGINAAAQAFDVPRTVAFLQQFLAAREPLPTIDPQEELRRQASPRTANGTVASPSTVVAPAQKIWSQQEIAEAYTRQIQGRSRLPAEQWAALEQEITQAVAEGRVR